ncbi:ATP-binding protein [Streptococcus suis]|uniref:ATP-binding protein n=1 Tax=Streptococcus suis TaxID=1307 RepID=UPI0021BC074E|nr:ATP-binding protein [Streptococcus suis]
MSNEFKLEYHAATIQHLGIGLYKQLPQAIAELISNSWDADSHNVEINIDYTDMIITVTDDGRGMSSDELNENFLTIARNRRLSDITKDGVSGFSKSGRKVTGKKGLGKLALFGIANTVIVESIQNRKKNSFMLNYGAIQDSSNNIYHPQTICYEEDTLEPDGTKITIQDITLKSLTPIDTLYESLSKRFNKYSRDDFLVKISSEKGDVRELDESVFINSIRPKSEDIEFTFEFPKDFSNETSEIINILSNKGITGTIYTKKTPLTAKKQGFSILSRGKLASEQSVTQFQDRANDRFYDYAAGYFDIDFLDNDAKKDFISTDRQSIRWEADEELVEIKDNLNKLMGIIQRTWRKKGLKLKIKKLKKSKKKLHLL